MKRIQNDPYSIWRDRGEVQMKAPGKGRERRHLFPTVRPVNSFMKAVMFEWSP
jgi:hypothetical protein